MRQPEENSIRLEDVLADEIMRKDLPKQYSKALLMRQLTDPSLMGLDLEDVCGMDMEALISNILLAQDLVMSEQTELVAMMEFEQAQKNQPVFEAVTLDAPSEGEQLAEILFDATGLEARILLHKPAEGKPAPCEADIRSALLRSGVVYGVKEDYVERLAQHPVYERKLKIALGKPPVSGEDGKLTFHFEPTFDLTPKIDKNGLADYKTLDYAQNVKQGDVLCDIVPATVGEAGYSVRGDMLTGKVGKPASLVCGSNVKLSTNGSELLATCDGHVILKGNRIIVSRVLEISHVDSSTGNVLFVGTVHVKGDVASGYSIRVGGDIIIDGVAENAALVASNNIVICGGVKGQEKGMLDAGGSIRSPFIESAHVKAKGHIYADVVLGSHLESEQSIKLLGRSGKLLGGTAIAGETLQAMEVGNDANLATSVSVQDPDPFGKAKAQNMLTIAKYKETIENLKATAAFAAASNLDDGAPEVMLCRAIVTKLRMEHAIKALERKNAETNAQRSRRRRIDVREVMHPNVTLTIEGSIYKNTMLRHGCNITKSANKLVFHTL